MRLVFNRHAVRMLTSSYPIARSSRRRGTRRLTLHQEIEVAILCTPIIPVYQAPYETGVQPAYAAGSYGSLRAMTRLISALKKRSSFRVGADLDRDS